MAGRAVSRRTVETAECPVKRVLYQVLGIVPRRGVFPRHGQRRPQVAGYQGAKGVAASAPGQGDQFEIRGIVEFHRF